MPSMRFHVSDLSERPIQLDAEESRHAKKVMRVRVGDTVWLFDGRGSVADGRVVSVDRTIEIEPGPVTRVEPLVPRIDLAVALPKGDRAAILAEKASELGANQLIPLLTERTVVDPGAGKLDRLRRIALESAKQSGRAWLMEVSEPRSLAEVLTRESASLKLIADTTAVAGAHSNSPPLEEGGRGRVGSMAPGSHDAHSVLILIGPEGGWTDAERKAAIDAGFHSWRLGPNILRVETAALAAVAILRRDA